MQPPFPNNWVKSSPHSGQEHSFKGSVEQLRMLSHLGQYVTYWKWKGTNPWISFDIRYILTGSKREIVSLSTLAFSPSSKEKNASSDKPCLIFTPRRKASISSVVQIFRPKGRLLKTGLNRTPLSGDEAIGTLLWKSLLSRFSILPDKSSSYFVKRNVHVLKMKNNFHWIIQLGKQLLIIINCSKCSHFFPNFWIPIMYEVTYN